MTMLLNALYFLFPDSPFNPRSHSTSHHPCSLFFKPNPFVINGGDEHFLRIERMRMRCMDGIRVHVLSAKYEDGFFIKETPIEFCYLVSETCLDRVHRYTRDFFPRNAMHWLSKRKTNFES